MRRGRSLQAAGVGVVLTLLAVSLQAQTIDVYPTPNQPSFPFGITAGPDGNVWFVERNFSWIGRITSRIAAADKKQTKPGSVARLR